MPAAGIISSKGAAETLAGVASIAVVNVLQGNNPVAEFSNLIGKYRPITWASGKTKYSIVTSQRSTPVSNDSGNYTVNATDTTTYVFDAIWRASHDLALNLTKKPVQTGFNISDNAVQVQPQIRLEIGMNDTMDEFKAGMWQGNASKSVSAFLTLQRLLQERVFLTLNTRLQSYSNVMLTRISVPEDAKTYHGLRALLTFEQVFVSTVASQTISARPQATGQTQLGSVQPSLPSSAATNNFKLPSPYLSQINTDNLIGSYGDIANAGNWSSNPTGTITSTLGK